MNRQTVGDVRGESLGELWPVGVVGVQEGWVVVDYTLDVDRQIAMARRAVPSQVHKSCRDAHKFARNLKVTHDQSKQRRAYFKNSVYGMLYGVDTVIGNQQRNVVLKNGIFVGANVDR